MKTPLACALLTLAVAALPAAAAPPAQYEVRHDGLVFRYTVTDRGRYRRILGSDSRGQRFSLLVSGRRVTGRYGFEDVCFDMPAPSRHDPAVATASAGPATASVGSQPSGE